MLFTNKLTNRWTERRTNENDYITSLEGKGNHLCFEIITGIKTIYKSDEISNKNLYWYRNKVRRLPKSITPTLNDNFSMKNYQKLCGIPTIFIIG